MVIIMHNVGIGQGGSGSYTSSPGKHHDQWRDFVQALHDKYVDQEEFDNQHIIPKDKSIGTEITFVGFGKVSGVQKQLKRISSIDLSSRNISSAGDIDQLYRALDRVTLLNLADNNLPWQEIVRILSCLPNLKELVITSNNLRESPTDYPAQHFRRLLSLTLGRVDLCWNEIINIISNIWSSVEQIDLWDNQLDSNGLELTNPEVSRHFTEQICELRFSRNNFVDIDWIAKAGHLDNLKELDLSRCKIRALKINQPVIAQLAGITTLNISYNDIDEWSSISNLILLPHLKSLMCNDNPFYITEKLAKSLVVARLGGLKFLNREEISTNMRRDSEILYLRKTFPEYKSFKAGTNADFARSHPRYDQLIELYGLPEDLNDKKPVEKYVTVCLCYEDKRVHKKLPLDIRISNLQMICKKLFKIRPSSKVEIVCHTSAGNEDAGYALDKVSQTLHFFSVRDGYNLIVSVS